MTLEEREQLTTLFEQYGKLLTQVQSQAMHLYLVEDLSLQEVADVLATSRQAVNDAIKKGKAKLFKIKEGLE